MSTNSKGKKVGIIDKIKSFFTFRPINSLSPLEFADLLQSGLSYQLIDVREPYELKLSNILGSIHIPLQVISRNIQDSIYNGKLSLEVTTVVYYRSGKRSKAAIQKMQSLSLGFKALYNLDGGINAYSNVDSNIRKH